MALPYDELALVPMRPADAALWFAWRQESPARRHNPFDPVPEEALVERIRTDECDLRRRGATSYRWIAEACGERVGVASARPNWPMGTVEIGYHLGERWHGRGLGKRLAQALVEMIFAQTDLSRVVATVGSENEASIRVVRGLGFEQEGRLRRHWLIDGRRVDVLVFGLVR